jgi:hypothetical protein
MADKPAENPSSSAEGGTRPPRHGFRRGTPTRVKPYPVRRDKLDFEFSLPRTFFGVYPELLSGFTPNLLRGLPRLFFGDCPESSSVVGTKTFGARLPFVQSRLTSRKHAPVRSSRISLAAALRPSSYKTQNREEPADGDVSSKSPCLRNDVSSEKARLPSSRYTGVRP